MKVAIWTERLILQLTKFIRNKMKVTKSPLFIVFILILCSCQNSIEEKNHLKLWYESPALATIADNSFETNDDPEWMKALPLGNGSMGAMVFGDVNRERIQLSEESMWSGSEDDNDNPGAKRSLDIIRQLLFEGKYKEATELTDATQICKGVVPARTKLARPAPAERPALQDTLPLPGNGSRRHAAGKA